MNELETMIATMIASCQPVSDKVVVTPEFVEDRVRHYMDVAKEELRAVGQEKSGQESGFMPKATVIMPDGTEANLGIAWNSTQQKREHMWRLSQTCKLFNVSACIIRINGTGANMAKIAKEVLHLNIDFDPTDRAKRQYLDERLFAWIKKTTGGNHLGDLPPQYRFDWLIVCGLGPRIPEISVGETYEWRDGKLEFTPIFKPGQGGMFIIDMFPKWWS